MLLETIKSLLIRSKKREVSITGTQSPPVENDETPTRPERTAITDGTRIAIRPKNVSDTNSGQIPAGQDAHSSHSNSWHTKEPVRTIPIPSFFSHAQNVVINNPTMIAQTIDSGGTVLQLLAQKRIPGAEVDSSARDPPPKCHPNTREGLRNRIMDWVSGPNRRLRMLWVIGPMGVGKSAVAQTIAEEMKALGRLGAALFFSRPNHRDDPDGVVPSLAYQFAVKCPEYKRIITQRLADDFTILEKNRRTQFKELIIEPFQILMTQHAHAVREPLLVILDGLDECRSKEAQCELTELIGDHIRQVDEFPLLWMICSRPEWHLKGMLSHPDFQVVCKREEIFIDDAEAQRDVARVLEAGFQEIRRKYSDRLDENWPPEAHIRRVSVTASGHFAFASTIIKFVGDEYRADPQRQLNICIRFLGGSDMPGAVNPLHAFDLLYRQLLSDVPEDVLPTTLRILGQSILYPNPLLSAHTQANFLSLDQATFFRSLQHLHSVLDVPTPMNAHHTRLHFYHASFADFLGNPLRSGSFSVNKRAVHYDVAIHSLKWQRRTMYVTEGIATHPPSNLRPKWAHNEVNADQLTSRLRNYSLSIGWRACCYVSDEDVPRVVTELERFDFRGIERQPPNFGDFLAWLHGLGDRNNSLISIAEIPMRSSTGPPTGNGAETLFVAHPVNDARAYLSGFSPPGSGLPRKEPYHIGIRLRVGRLDRARNVHLTGNPPIRGFYDTLPKWTAGPHYGPVLTPLQLKAVGAQLQLNPILTPDDNLDIVRLRWNMLAGPGLIHRSYALSQVIWSTGRNEPATFPRLSDIKIVSENYPWPVDVTARDPDFGVTCGDVAEAIASDMSTFISKEHLDELLQIQESATNGLTRPRNPSDTGRRAGEVFKRANFLGDVTIFGGLEVNDKAVERICRVAMPNYVVLKCVKR